MAEQPAWVGQVGRAALQARAGAADPPGQGAARETTRVGLGAVGRAVRFVEATAPSDRDAPRAAVHRAPRRRGERVRRCSREYATAPGTGRKRDRRPGRRATPRADPRESIRRRRRRPHDGQRRGLDRAQPRRRPERSLANPGRSIRLRQPLRRSRRRAPGPAPRLSCPAAPHLVGHDSPVRSTGSHSRPTVLCPTA